MFTPTRFYWRFGGRQVHLCGSFTRWVETIPMAPVDGSPGAFAVVVHLPPGYHQYKFIVDGKWLHDETAPYMPDPLGNVNNWLFVRKVEPPPQPVTGTTFEQQQQQQQQQAAAQQLLQQQQQAAATAATALLQQQQQQQQQQQAAAAAQQQAAALQPPRLQAISTPGFASGGGGSGMAVAPGALSAALAAAGAAPGTSAGGGGGGGSGGGDVDMADSSSAGAPIIALADKEPDLTKKKVSDFLHAHTAYELIPESGRAVVLDADLPVRVAFHALYEQGCASAPIWDGAEGTVVGVVSASDFIHTLQRLRSAVSRSGNNPLSEAEMDAHTIRGMREAAAAEGNPPKPLVYVTPGDSLAKVVRTLFRGRVSMAPILSADPGGPEVPAVLHSATLGGVLSCLLRHFRASLASLPLLSQPLGGVALGTWSEAAAAGHDHLRALAERGGGSSDGGGGGGAPNGRAKGGGGVAAYAGKDGGTLRVRPLAAVAPSTPLTTALGLLLEAGVSALPVLDGGGRLLDVYARADITALCRGNAYSRLQWEDVTVGQALSLSQASGGWAPGGPLMPAAPGGAAGPAPGLKPGGRVAVVAPDEPLRSAVERLALPGVRRLVVADRGSGAVLGVVSLSDVCELLFL